VLVIKLGAMGDFMQALGAFRVVRATHPSARITLLTTPNPMRLSPRRARSSISLRPMAARKDLKGKGDLIRRLRSAGYDMVYDFQNNDRTAQYYHGADGQEAAVVGRGQGLRRTST
jgi:ADP-heptose:LPS heptosyltransferase